MKKLKTSAHSDSPIMFYAGNHSATIEAATSAVVTVLKACDTDAKAEAAFGALRELARSPSSVTVSGCTFDASRK